MNAFMKCLAAAVLLASSSCFNYGNRIEDFPPASGPEGAQVTVQVFNEPTARKGELYAIDSAGVIIRGEGLVRIHWRKIGSFDTDRMGSEYSMRGAELYDEARRAAIASVSRFPQGLTAAQITTILERLPSPPRTLEEIN